MRFVPADCFPSHSSAIRVECSVTMQPTTTGNYLI